MCGATSEQKSLEAKQAAFYDTLTAEYKTVFGKQQGILDSLTAMFQPILAKGPSQRGFSPEERTALDTQATEGVATNFAQAKQGLNEDLAARGGSDFIPSGVDTQIREGLAVTGAAERSNLENQIEKADWETGRQNWAQAAGVLGGVASELNPNATANSATGAGSAAATTADQIAMADNSVWSSVTGALGGIAGAAVGGWAGKQKKGG